MIQHGHRPLKIFVTGASGTGNGTVAFSIAANTGSTSRSGTLTVGGQTFTVTQAGAAPTFNSQSDCFFNWVEINYPGFFAPAGTISITLTPFYYRFYSQTNAYLATSSPDNHLYYLGPLSSYAVVDLGAMSLWLSLAGCQ